VLIHDDAFRVAAVGDPTEMLVGAAVGQSVVGAKLFQAFLAGGSGAIRIHHAADGYSFSLFKIRHG
jgi:hypothetical protein